MPEIKPPDMAPFIMSPQWQALRDSGRFRCVPQPEVVAYTADISPEIMAKAYRQTNWVKVAIGAIVGFLLGVIWVACMWNSNYDNMIVYSTMGQTVPPPQTITGIASWYDYKLDGKMWSKENATAATRDLPRYTYAVVENLENNYKICVFINDYGPQEYTGRVIDLSSFAFGALGSLDKGLMNVKITPMSKDKCLLSTSNYN